MKDDNSYDVNIPRNTPVNEISMRKEFLDENMEEIHKARSPRVCQIQRFGKNNCPELDRLGKL